ncbi:MAG: multiheme c-type cytochrome [Blastocatellia bacterium]
MTSSSRRLVASTVIRTRTAWSESLHRNAAREPFYRESADILLRTRGIELTRHCESCHTPVALFSGALAKESKRQQAPFTPLDDEGVTCSVCHSITEARLDGTGSFTIRRPALLAREDGTPLYGDFTDEQILADVPAHKRAVMRPLLKSPEFCATCHKVDAPPSLNNYKHIRGFSAYDDGRQHRRAAFLRPTRTGEVDRELPAGGRAGGGHLRHQTRSHW